MERDIKKEISLLDSNSHITNKLLIYSLYNEVYNFIMYPIDSVIERKYSQFLIKTFELILSSLDLNCKDATPNQFMKTYLGLLKFNNLSQIPQISYSICELEKELENLEEKMNYVRKIDSYDLSLETKVRIILIFREYFNHVISSLIRNCGERKTKELGDKIFNILENTLEAYLTTSLSKNQDENTIINNLEKELSTKTKEYLISIIDKGFNIKQDEQTFYFLSTCTEEEKKILKMSYIYEISAYEAKDEERVLDLCTILGISQEQYKQIISNLNLKIQNEYFSKSNNDSVNPPKK